MSSKTAYLELVIGPMFSGKTSRIIDIYKKAKFCDKSILVINYTYDQRYSKTELSSHDKIMIPCTQTTSLNSLFNLKTKTGNIDISTLDTGKIPMKGHNVSHANNKTKRRFLPNLKKVKFTSELLKRSLKLTVSNAGVRCVDKKGTFDQFLKDVKNKNISPRLKKLKKSILIKSPFKKAPVRKSV